MERKAAQQNKNTSEEIKNTSKEGLESVTFMNEDKLIFDNLNM